MSSPPNHPTEEALKALALGRLPADTTESLWQHLDACADCLKVLIETSGDRFVDRLRAARGKNATPAPPRSVSEPSSSEKQASRTILQASTISPVEAIPSELTECQDFEILHELGRGGMGVVYLARNRMMDRLEVLKVMNNAFLSRPGALERFLREIQAAARLSHPNIVNAYTARAMGSLVVFAMEYVEGEDLAKVVKSRGPLPVVNACVYARQVAQGLQHAHERGMAHRDVKPANLILAREGKKHTVKVLDFGLAKLSTEKALVEVANPGGPLPMRTDLTGAGRMLGTPDFMAPEQILDAASADIRADIYSLGCTLYYLLTGGPPFRCSKLLELLIQHKEATPRALNEVRPEVPLELAAIVAKMMQKDPANRYQTPAEVEKELKVLLKPTRGGIGESLPSASGEHSWLGKTSDPSSIGSGFSRSNRPDDSHATARDAPGDKSRSSASFVPFGSTNAMVAGSIAPTEARTRSSLAGSVDRSQVPLELPIETGRRTSSDEGRPEEVPSATPRRWKIAAVVVGLLLVALIGLGGWAGGAFKKRTTNSLVSVDNSASSVKPQERRPEASVPTRTPPPGISEPPALAPKEVAPMPRPGTSNALWTAGAKYGKSSLPGHQGYVISACFSRDGKWLLTAGYDDGAARLWDVASGREIKSFQGHPRLFGASFSPDATRIVTVGGDLGASEGVVKLWDVSSAAELRSLRTDGSACSAVFSPDGKRLAIGARRDATIHDAVTGAVLLTLNGHKGPIPMISFSSDGTKILTASADKTAKIWDANQGTVVTTMKGHWEKLRTAAFNFDASRVATTSEDGTVKIWHGQSGRKMHELEGDSQFVIFSPDDAVIVTGTAEGALKFWDMSSGKSLHTLAMPFSWVASASFNADGSRIVATTGNGLIQIWTSK